MTLIRIRRWALRLDLDTPRGSPLGEPFVVFELRAGGDLHPFSFCFGLLGFVVGLTVVNKEWK